MQSPPEIDTVAARSSPRGEAPSRLISGSRSASGVSAGTARETTQSPETDIPGTTPEAPSPSAAKGKAGSVVASGVDPQKSAFKMLGRTLAEWTELARAEFHSGKRARPFVSVMYAAGAANKMGLDVHACPFDIQTEGALAEEWVAFFQALNTASHREQRSSGARSEFMRPKRRVHTTSAAYAEQCGGDVVDGDGE